VDKIGLLKLELCGRYFLKRGFEGESFRQDLKDTFLSMDFWEELRDF